MAVKMVYSMCVLCLFILILTYFVNAAHCIKQRDECQLNIIIYM